MISMTVSGELRNLHRRNRPQHGVGHESELFQCQFRIDGKCQNTAGCLLRLEKRTNLSAFVDETILLMHRNRIVDFCSDAIHSEGLNQGIAVWNSDYVLIEDAFAIGTNHWRLDAGTGESIVIKARI